MLDSKLRKAGAAAIGVLLAIAALDDSNIVGQIAREAAKFIGIAFGIN